MGVEITKALGFQAMIGPVRPTLKTQFPFLSMDEYLEKRTDENQIFDPWIRLHVRSGGQILNVCRQSVIVTATLQKWQSWTNQKFISSGAHEIPQGLVPLVVDVEKNLGTYIEPNVWVRYNL